jgi:hypothetical protein
MQPPGRELTLQSEREIKSRACRNVPVRHQRVANGVIALFLLAQAASY